MDLVIAASQLAAVVNIRRAHSEGGCAVRDGGTVLDIDAVAGRDAVPEVDQIRIGASTEEYLRCKREEMELEQRRDAARDAQHP